jgi:sugar diacid utilization regulator
VLRKSFPNILFCSSSALSEELDEKIVCCVPLAHLPKEAAKNRFGTEMSTRFIQLAQNLNLQYFCSYPLTGIEQLSAQFRQAEICQQQGKTWYYDCALSDLADFRSSSLTRQLALHPALARILQYDQQKNTDFYHILKTYLRCERDRVLTAQLLYQHKNTLVYRLEKIKELFTLDLDDPYEREYLLISFRCMDLL